MFQVAVITTIVRTGGVLVDFSPGLMTNELGSMAEFTLELLVEPTADVTIPLSSADVSEGTLMVSSVTFTTDDWDIPQTVEITGINDALLDGNAQYIIRTGPIISDDPNYANVDPADITITNQDDDVPNLLLSQSGGTTRTAEAGSADTYSLVLASQPTAAVTVTVTPDTQARVNGSAVAINLTFTTGACPGPGNWCVPQNVSVLAIDDAANEGAHVSMIGNTITSADVIYNGLAALTIQAAILDNDGSLKIFLSKAKHNGAFDTDASLAGGTAAATNADGNAIPEADNFCDQDRANPARNTGIFRAMLVDNANRIASVSANAGDGQAAWVFKPNRVYGKGRRTRRVFTSDANSIFVFGTLRRSFGGGKTRYWTGLAADWTTSTNHCTGWTVNSAGANRGSRGRANQSDAAAITGSGGNNRCHRMNRVICVQQ